MTPTTSRVDIGVSSEEVKRVGWYRVKVRKAGRGKNQLEITVPMNLVKQLGLAEGDYVLATVMKKLPSPPKVETA